jgi:hypothetical protein
MRSFRLLSMAAITLVSLVSAAAADTTHRARPWHYTA